MHLRKTPISLHICHLHRSSSGLHIFPVFPHSVKMGILIAFSPLGISMVQGFLSSRPYIHGISDCGEVSPKTYSLWL